MTRNIKSILSTFALLTSVGVGSTHAQFYKSTYDRLHVGSMDLGATGQFSTILEQNPNGGNGFFRVGSSATLNPTPASNQQQYTTNSVGFLVSIGMQPVKWAGVEVNYGYTHYSEKYSFNYAITPATQQATVPTDWHELTGAYMIHPKHIPFQPFVGIGGGAIDFTPRNASNQWRGAGLLETGFDIKTRNPHLGFRVEGRSLYYRSPNFYQPAISTRSWRVTEQPTVSAHYNF